jgi:hypothetical protein
LNQCQLHKTKKHTITRTVTPMLTGHPINLEVSGIASVRVKVWVDR